MALITMAHYLDSKHADFRHYLALSLDYDSNSHLSDADLSAMKLIFEAIGGKDKAIRIISGGDLAG